MIPFNSIVDRQESENMSNEIQCIAFNSIVDRQFYLDPFDSGVLGFSFQFYSRSTPGLS